MRETILKVKMRPKAVNTGTMSGSKRMKRERIIKKKVKLKLKAWLKRLWIM